MDKIIEELLAYEIKWDYDEFKKYYKSKNEFKEVHKRIIEHNPNQLYRYVTDKFDEIIKFYDLEDIHNIDRLHDTTDLLIKIGKFLQVRNVKII